MKVRIAFAAIIAGVLTVGAPSGATAGAAASAALPARADTAIATPGETAPQPVQYWRGRPAYGPRYYPAPRAYVGPGWGYRPWYRRPYYGTVIAGVALGTLIGVTAYGLAPPRPRPDLCWYWADEVQSRGYWDYC